jgi:hypothetical protein
LPPKRRGGSDEPPTARLRPVTTPEARENQLIALSFDVAERRLREGTASAQEVVHFLKLGSSREKLEQERLALENGLVAQKTEALREQAKVADLIADALNAMRGYAGLDSAPQGDDYDNPDVY